MADVKDLMVGNWLQHANGKYYQVTRIDLLSDGNIHFACGTPHLWEYNNKFNPIPLTLDIIKKNNPTYFSDLDVSDIGGLAISYYEEEDEEPEFDVGRIGIGFHGDEFQYFTSIKYVHQLQNLLTDYGYRKEFII